MSPSRGANSLYAPRYFYKIGIVPKIVSEGDLASKEMQIRHIDSLIELIKNECTANFSEIIST